jgi:hypothetical protein
MRFCSGRRGMRNWCANALRKGPKKSLKRKKYGKPPWILVLHNGCPRGVCIEAMWSLHKGYCAAV